MNTDRLTTIAGIVGAAAQGVKLDAPEYGWAADVVSALALAVLGYFTNKGTPAA
jgi:1,6-anhydro-N-acetylmuramate kinase